MFKEYYAVVAKFDEEYMPSYPPMSPLTGSYFTSWCFFDFRFGKAKETLSTIFYDLAMEYHFEEMIKNALNNFNNYSMRFYKHIGFEDDLVVLKEIITNKEVRCISTSGYKGKIGEIWYVRIVPNLDEVYDYYVIFNTPYVIINYSEKDWISFFQRQVADSHKPN